MINNHNQQPGDKPNIQGGNDCTGNALVFFGFEGCGNSSKNFPADSLK